MLKSNRLDKVFFFVLMYSLCGTQLFGASPSITPPKIQPSVIPTPGEGAIPQKRALDKKLDAKRSIDVKKSLGSQQPVFHDVMMFFDVSEYSFGVITHDFILAICQNGWSDMGYPIVATSNLVRNFLHYQDDAIQKIVAVLLDRFDVYATKQEDVYLFLPKTYTAAAKKNFKTEQIQYISNEIVKGEKGNLLDLNDIITGFKLSSLSKISDFLNKNIRVASTINVSSIKSLFVTKQDLMAINSSEKDYWNMLNLLGGWNIVLDGHGVYSVSLAKKIEQGIMPDAMKFLSVEDFADAQIAGLLLNDYKSLLQFFINAIDTKFLYYSTCYAGGYNTILSYIDALINNRGVTVSQKKPNFIVVTGAITDATVPGVKKDIVESCVACTAKIDAERSVCIAQSAQKRESTDYVGFFKELHAFQGEKFLESGVSVNSDEQLRKALSRITVMRDENVHGIPQIMFPNTGYFRAFSIDDTIFVLNDSLVKKHTLEKKPIVIENKKNIVLYPLEIMPMVDIRGKEKVAIISANPIVSFHTFNGINFNSTLQDFLWGLGMERGDSGIAFDKYFYIKQLKVKKNAIDIMLRHVLLHVKGRAVDYCYVDETNTLYHGENKLSNFSSQVLEDQNAFFNVVGYYLSRPKVRTSFLFDKIFVHILEPHVVQILKKEIDQYVAQSARGIIAELERKHPKGSQEIYDALKAYYNEYPHVFDNPNYAGIEGGYRAPVIFSAIEKKDIPAVLALLKLGADIDLVMQGSGKYPFSPLWFAIDASKRDDKDNRLVTIARMLLEGGADIYYKIGGKRAQEFLNPMPKAMSELLQEFENPERQLEIAARINGMSIEKMREVRNILATQSRSKKMSIIEIFPYVLINPNKKLASGSSPLSFALSGRYETKVIDALFSLKRKIDSDELIAQLVDYIQQNNVTAVKYLLSKIAVDNFSALDTARAYSLQHLEEALDDNADWLNDTKVLREMVETLKKHLGTIKK